MSLHFLGIPPGGFLATLATAVLFAELVGYLLHRVLSGPTTGNDPQFASAWTGEDSGTIVPH